MRDLCVVYDLYRKNVGKESYMGFLSKLMGNDKKLAESLRDRYVHIFLTMNYDTVVAKAKATEIINSAIQAIQESGKKMPCKMGEQIIKGVGFPDAQKIRDWLRKEYVTDDDIRAWWNLPELERWVIIKFDEYQLSEAREKLLQKKKSEVEVEKSLLRLFPMFDFIEEIGDSTFPDRALPHELRGRVGKWMQSMKSKGKYEFHKMTLNATSMNAIIRESIKKGEL